MQMSIDNPNKICLIIRDKNRFFYRVNILRFSLVAVENQMEEKFLIFCWKNLVL